MQRENICPTRSEPRTPDSHSFERGVKIYTWNSKVWFDLMTRHDMSMTILQGILVGVGQRKNWLTNMKEWSGRPVQDLLTIVQNRRDWRAVSAAASIMCSP